MDLNHIGIMDDAVADGVCQGEILMPAWYIHLRTKDGGGRLCSGFNQFENIPCFTLFERVQQPFIQNEQLYLLQFLHELAVGAVTPGNGNLHQQIRQADVTDRIKVPAGRHAESASQIGLADSGGSQKNDINLLLAIAKNGAT